MNQIDLHKRAEIELYRDYRDGVQFRSGAWLNSNGFVVGNSCGQPVTDLNTLSLNFTQQPVAILYDDPNEPSKRILFWKKRPKLRWIATIHFRDAMGIAASETDWYVELMGDDLMGVAKHAVDEIIQSLDPVNISARFVLKDARVTRQYIPRDW